MDDFGDRFLSSGDIGGNRDSLDEMDELVQRNIQDVLQAADIQEASASFSREEPSAASRDRALRPSSSALNRERPLSRGQSRGATPSSAGGSASLTVPGNAEATLRLHKAKIQGLEDQVTKLTKGFNDKERALNEALKDLKSLKIEQANWNKAQKSLEVQVDKYRRIAEDAESGKNGLQHEVKELSREGGRVEREKRASESEARSRDARLSRALEEVERYKQMLQDLKSNERDGKDVAKSDYNKVVTDNKKLERQRAELVVAFKKQLKLIDVLKRQKVHLEAARALQFTEQEFLQTLEMGQG